MLFFNYGRFFFVVLLGAMLALFESGCDMIVGDPRIEIVVNQVDEGVTFEFFIQKGTWWARRPERVPHQMKRFFITDATSIIWDIQTRDVRVGVYKSKYGVMPEGFKQIDPQNGTPPALKPDREYTAVAAAEGTGNITFVYKALRPQSAL